jgi:hypothetical protein
MFPLLRRGNVVAGEVAPDVTRVVIRRGEGRATVATVPAPDGARAFIARIPSGRGPVFGIARRADGRRVGEGLDITAGVTLTATLARWRGQVLKALTAFPLGHPSRCVVSLGGLGADGFCDGDRRDQLSVEVRCHPRQTMIYGRVLRGERRPTITLDDGSTLSVRLLRARPHRAFVAFVPAARGIRSVTIGTQDTPVPLPPAREQCGYGSQLSAG